MAAVDIFGSTVDPLKEPPLVIANTVLSILAVDYPVDKASCYVLDDGSSMVTFEALSETSEFARKWVLFCKKYDYLALDKIDFKWPGSSIGMQKTMKVKIVIVIEDKWGNCRFHSKGGWDENCHC